MKETHTTRTRLLTVLGVLVAVALILTIPSPVHDWFVETKINGVPLKFGLLTLCILFTPPTVLALALRTFDDDVDASVQDDGLPDHMAHHAH